MGGATCVSGSYLEAWEPNVWWWLSILLACEGAPKEAAALALPPGRAVVQDCTGGGQRPAAPLEMAEPIPESAAPRLAGVLLSGLPTALDGGAPDPAGMDLTLVVDRSGSMVEAGRIGFVKRGLTRLTEGVRPGDRVNLVVFDNEACVALEDWVAGRDDVGILYDAVAAITPRGSTDLGLGLHTGYRVATRAGTLEDAARRRRVVLITDALVASGGIAEGVAAEVERAWQLYRLDLTAVSLGDASDGELLATLAQRGGGRHTWLGARAWRSDGSLAAAP